MKEVGWIILIIIAAVAMWALLVSAEADILKFKTLVPTPLFGYPDTHPPDLADLERRIEELVNKLQLTHLFLSITATVITILSTLISIFGRK